MSKINFLRISQFLGIDERELEAAKINIFKGPNGKGKTSVIEAIEKTLTNKNRRTEVIKHGQEEATLYVELDDGLSIDRKVRSGKGDYLKVRQDGKGIESTEKFISSLVNGNIFRPLDWVTLSPKEQTKSLLSMLEIGWSEEDIVNWFGDLVDDIDYSQHILLILKSIEQKYYKTREEVNREIKELKARIDSIYVDLPAEYSGDEWKDKNVQAYYAKVKEAQDINKWISEAKALQDNFNSKVAEIKANAESEKSRIILKYKSEREDINDIIILSNSKIEKANSLISNSDHELELKIQEFKNGKESQGNIITNNYHNSLKELEEEFAKRKNDIEISYKSNLEAIEKMLTTATESVKKESILQVNEQKDLIFISETKIATKQQELIGLDEKEKTEKTAVDEKVKSEIEKEEIRIGKAAKYLKEHEEIDIEPLQNEANNVQKMVSYLRDWDRIIEIRDNQLAPKERYSDELTTKIEKARILPSELLKTATMPIEGISVDENGSVRIKGTLIDGLSEGQKLELAMRVAKAQCGELKIICMDKWESLDKQAQEALLTEMTEDEYQYFVTEVAVTENGEIEVEKIG
jgi:exonuclease SbcC